MSEKQIDVVLSKSASIIFDDPSMNMNDVSRLLKQGRRIINSSINSVASTFGLTYRGPVVCRLLDTSFSENRGSLTGMAVAQIDRGALLVNIEDLKRYFRRDGISDNPDVWPLMPRTQLTVWAAGWMDVIADSPEIRQAYDTGKANHIQNLPIELIIEGAI